MTFRVKSVNVQIRYVCERCLRVYDEDMDIADYIEFNPSFSSDAHDPTGPAWDMLVGRICECEGDRE